MQHPFLITPHTENSSFLVRKIEGSTFERHEQCHEEDELILIISGRGSAFLKETKTFFEPGDVLFLRAQTPHYYEPNNNESTSAVLIQFNSNLFGNHFLNLPECQSIMQLLKRSLDRIYVFKKSNLDLQSLIWSLLTSNGINKLTLLLQCLQIISKEYENHISSIEGMNNYRHLLKDKLIDKIFHFTQESFHESLSLQQAASAVCMSVPSFCHYFKQYTNKTYIGYLNEVRIEYACVQLRETNKSVSDIGFKCGFNTTAHFHRQFLKLKEMTPLQYRKNPILDPAKLKTSAHII